MPELPEVETVKNGLEAAIAGERILKVHVYRRDLRIPIPPNFSAQIEGNVATGFRRRAKYILMELSNKKTVIMHLGMSGTFRIAQKKNENCVAQKHDHVRFDLANGICIFYHDPRRFGCMDITDTNNADSHKSLFFLGAEPLTKEFNAAFLMKKFEKKNLAIKQAIMDQHVVVGVGNIYASEALYMARISPLLSSKDLDKDSATRLVDAIKKVLKKAIEKGGSTLRDYRQVSGDIGDFQSRFSVYDRTGERCPHCVCDIARTGGIRRVVQGGRSSFYCPVIQESQ